MFTLKESLIRQAIGEELILFDSSTQKAHSLNANAALVANLLLSESGDPTSLSRRVAQEMSIGQAEAEAVVGETLLLLEDQGLLEASDTTGRPSVSRRNFLKAASVVAPALLTVAVPRPAAAASCFLGTCTPAIGGTGFCANRTVDTFANLCMCLGQTIPGTGVVYDAYDAANCGGTQTAANIGATIDCGSPTGTVDFPFPPNTADRVSFCVRF